MVELNQLLYADHHEKHHAIITENPEMLSNIAKAKRLAASNIPVTIVGRRVRVRSYFPPDTSMQQAGE